jgi:hypothetical protein
MARLSKALVFLALIGAPLVLAQPQGEFDWGWGSE